MNKPVEFWRHKIYGDEAAFNTSTRGSHWVTRTEGERYHDDCIDHTFQSGRATVVVFGAISYNWKSPLVIIEGHGKRGGMTFNDYLNQILIPIIAPALNGDPDLGFTPQEFSDYVEDSAGPHGTKKIGVKPKQELGIERHLRPATSPDMNPIEHEWLLMKRRIQARPIFRGIKEATKKAVIEEWDRMQPSDWNKLIDSMPSRIRDLKERRGLQTRY